MSSFNKKHFQFSIMYFLFCFISMLYFEIGFTLNIFIEIAIGFFLYFGLQYAVFLNFFALAQRSISSSVLILLSENNDSLSIDEIYKMYANGKSFSYIKEDRLSDMKELHWINMNLDRIQLTSKGKKIISLVNFFLKIWGLNQVGK